jgi:tetratricopeptide (TPR) repeat protein
MRKLVLLIGLTWIAAGWGEDNAHVGLLHKNKNDQMLDKAIAHMRDQDLERGFQVFLDALEDLKDQPAPSVSEEEKGLYEKALKIYESRESHCFPKENALKIYQEFKQIADSRKEYYLLNLVMGTAYANLGRFEEFFNVFYRSYPYYKDHYLSYKIRAIVHIKLFERARTLQEREGQGQLVYTHILKAIEKNPSDLGLYKIAILFAPDTHKQQAVELAMHRFVDENVAVPRGDVYFFAYHAVSAGLLGRAQKFVDQSRAQYQYSRAIDEAQEYINKHK